jgi:hypothetical protein
MANKFLTNVELDAGLVDGSNSTGTSGYLLSSTGTATSWVDPAAVSVGESEQVHIACKNTSGVAISKGDPVYITGTVGTSFIIQIAKADASDSVKMPAVGLAETDLGLNAEGFVIVSGVLKNLTTDPLSTSDGTPSSNDTVYVKAGGGLTRTKPTGSGNLIQNVGKVGRISSANSGSLAVSTIMRTNDVPNLTTGKIWVGSPTYTTESTVVHLDETNGRMGIGTTSPAKKLHVNSGSTNEVARFESTDGTAYLSIMDSATSGSLQGIGSVGDALTLYSNSGERIRINSSGNVGIGITSPSTKLHVGSTSFSSNSVEEVRIQSATSGGFGGTATLNLVTGTYGVSGVYFGNNSTYTAQPAHVKWVDVSNMLEYNSNSVHVFKYSGSEIFRTSGTSIGMGVTGIPAAKLDIYTSGDALNVRSTQSVGIKVQGGGNNKDIAQFSNSAGAVVAALDTAGQLGIGTDDPQAELHVQSPTNATPTIRLNHNSTYPAWMIEATQYNSSSPPRGQLRWDANPGATGMQLVYWNSYTENALKLDGQNFKVINNGSERMRIDNAGDVGIGVTNPGEKLEVNGTVKATATTDAYKGYIKNTITCTPLMKSANTNYNYIPYNTTIFSSTPDYFNRMAAAYDGRVKKIILRHISGTTPTATGMKFKKEVNGTVSTTEYTATVTGGASTSFTATYNFANSDFTFSEGDSIGILAQTSGGTGNIGGASAQIIVEYNIT